MNRKIWFISILVHFQSIEYSWSHPIPVNIQPLARHLKRSQLQVYHGLRFGSNSFIWGPPQWVGTLNWIIPNPMSKHTHSAMMLRSSKPRAVHSKRGFNPGWLHEHLLTSSWFLSCAWSLSYFYIRRLPCALQRNATSSGGSHWQHECIRWTATMQRQFRFMMISAFSHMRRVSQRGTERIASQVLDMMYYLKGMSMV